MSDRDCRIYVGNLPADVRERDIEDVFGKYGRIRATDIKNGRGPAFAFIDFEDARDAEDAVRGRDGYDFDGYRLRVEFPRGVGPRGVGGRPMRDGGSSRGAPPPRRSGYRVKITGLPPTGSWQDLKDHMREAGDVCYADANGDGSGVVEFSRYEDMRRAIKKLDDTKFRSHEGETAYIRVEEESGGGRGGRSRSRSPPARRGGRNSPKYSPRRSRSRSRSPKSRSVSRSRSRS
ncbi:unnamed protein product, partial [Mesorhabditis spiculigera]